jgi:hypothetical protein
MEIREALHMLDPLDDDHWTSNGSPRLDIIESLVESKVTRRQLLTIAPDFRRETPTIEAVVDSAQAKRAALEEAEAAVQAAEAVQAEATLAAEKLQAQRDRLIETTVPEQRDSFAAIERYLASQRELQVAHADRRQQLATLLADAGISFSDLESLK